MFENVPQELRTYAQWIVWRSELVAGTIKPTKVPFSPNTGHEASIVDRRNWTTFEQAIAYNQAHGFNGIGFCLSTDDPYCFIDLDDTEGDQLAFERQQRIHDAFDSYSEFSPSGRGVHIICKGHVSSGRKRAHIEIYSQARFMTVTGNTLFNKPIEDRQVYVDALWNEIGDNIIEHYVTGDIEQQEENDTVLAKALSAKNGDKFRLLYDGRWQEAMDERTGHPYASQSEADFALINIIAYHTRNRNQIRAMFWNSGLGKRPKANRIDYIEKMITRSFDNQVPLVDVDGIRNSVLAKMAAKEEARVDALSGQQTRASQKGAVQTPSVSVAGPLAVVNGHPALAYQSNQAASAPPLPPGIIGDLAQFMYAAAPRPVPDIALMGAIALMAGICGRSWNISGTGLNIYMLMLAKSGRGKEQMSSGVDKLMNALRLRIPAIQTFIGPGDIASGQAVIKYMTQFSPVFVSIIGEFDKFLFALSNPHANQPTTMLRKFILDAYGKSGEGQNYRAMIYSETSKNTPIIQSPAMTILGECTPEKFYAQLDETQISDGLLPRFMVMEYHGDRVDDNEGRHGLMPSQSLQNRLFKITETALILSKAVDGQIKVNKVNWQPNVYDVYRQFDRFCTYQINHSNREAVTELWNRAGVNTLKLAGLVSVGLDPHYPIVTRETIDWAINYVTRSVTNMLERFDVGDVGSGEVKQLSETRRIMIEMIEHPYEATASRYRVNRLSYSKGIIPYTYIQRRLTATSVFMKDRMGADFAIKRALRILLEGSEIVEVNRDQNKNETGSTARSFMIKEMKL